MVLGTGLAVLIVDRFGRRILLISPAFFMCASIFGLGTFFLLKENVEVTCADEMKTDCVPKDGYFDEEAVDNLGMMPLVCLISYVVAFSIGEK